MAHRFYGYQYGTNPRKLNSEYPPYRNRYPKKEEPVTTTSTKNRTKNTVKSNSKAKTINKIEIEKRKKSVKEYERKQVKSSKVNNKIDINKPKKAEVETTISVHNIKVTKAIVKAKLKMVMLLITGFSVLFAISYQNSLINESFNRKEQYKKELESLSKTNQQIEVNIENNLNLNYIEQVAREKLGMQKLSNEQKIYVSLPKEDYVAPATEQIVMEEDVGFFEKIFRWFSK